MLFAFFVPSHWGFTVNGLLCWWKFGMKFSWHWYSGWICSIYCFCLFVTILYVLRHICLWYLCYLKVCVVVVCRPVWWVIILLISLHVSFSSWFGYFNGYYSYVEEGSWVLLLGVWSRGCLVGCVVVLGPVNWVTTSLNLLAFGRLFLRKQFIILG